MDWKGVWKDYLIRSIVALFLFLLVSMLIVTLLPGDAEKSFLGALTGESSTKAGEIGGQNVPIDYFNAARRDCYYQYSRYGREMAQNMELINSCAFSTIRELYVMRDVAKSVGYSVSEVSIKRKLSEEARRIHKETSSQAGYSIEDSKTPEQIYLNLLRSIPMDYRLDSSVGYSLFDSFVLQNLPVSKTELELEEGSKSAKTTFRLLVYSDSDLMDKLEKQVTISDEEIKKEYDKEEGSLPKPAFEERKSILASKVKFEKKRNLLEEWKRKAQEVSKTEGGLEAVSKELGLSIQTSSSPFSEWTELKTPNGKKLSLGTQKIFWEAIGQRPFGKKKTIGPLSVGEDQIYLEFGDLILDKGTPIKKQEEFRENRSQMLGYFIEIQQSLGEQYGIQKNQRIGKE